MRKEQPWSLIRSKPSLTVILLVMALITACAAPAPPPEQVVKPTVTEPSDQVSSGNTDQPTSPEETTTAPNLQAQVDQALEQADQLAKGYFYDEALEALKPYADDDKVAAQIASIEGWAEELVEYTGEIHHVFLHSLIIYPDLAFDDVGHPKAGYNSTMSTRDEFVKLLPQIYERGFVLYNINDIFSKDDSGAMVQNKIFLPEGKKPLVLSQDDVSYYPYMETDGFATRLVIDADGQIATEVKDKDGNVSNTRDGDLIPIVDDFLKEHPDFSFRGAKGIIALTGYEGVLGYRLETKADRKAAKKVANAIKADGWLFANHSFTHNREGFWGPGSQVSNIEYDVRRWNEVDKPIVGATNLFISPFGWVLQGEGMKVITDAGYDIYCSVVSRPTIDTDNPKIAIQGRYEIAGYNMINDTEHINETFFDVDSVIDKTRPTEMG